MAAVNEKSSYQMSEEIKEKTSQSISLWNRNFCLLRFLARFCMSLRITRVSVSCARTYARNGRRNMGISLEFRV